MEFSTVENNVLTRDGRNGFVPKSDSFIPGHITDPFI